jgi:hypothetical protein
VPRFRLSAMADLERNSKRILLGRRGAGHQIQCLSRKEFAMLIELTLRGSNEPVFINTQAIISMKRAWSAGVPIGSDICMQGLERFFVNELPVDIFNSLTPLSLRTRIAELKYLEEKTRLQSRDDLYIRHVDANPNSEPQAVESGDQPDG